MQRERSERARDREHEQHRRRKHFVISRTFAFPNKRANLQSRQAKPFFSGIPFILSIRFFLLSVIEKATKVWLRWRENATLKKA